MEIYRFIGERIRELRDEGHISQDSLAKELGKSTNTISRWETATYKPSIDELQKVADYFGVRLTSLLPPEEGGESPQKALLSAMGDLHPDDVAELVKYAEYRRARRRLEGSKKRQ